MPRIIKESPEETEKRILRNTFGDLNNPNIEGVDIRYVEKYYPGLLKKLDSQNQTRKSPVQAPSFDAFEQPKKKKFDASLSLQTEPFERDLYYHANVSKSRLAKLSAKDQEEYYKNIGDIFDNKENLVLYVQTVFPKKYNKGEIIEKIRLEKRGFKTKDDIDKFILDNNIVKKSPSLRKKIEKLIDEITSTSIPKVKRHKTSDDVIKTIFNVLGTKIPKNIKAHDTSDDVLKAIFDMHDIKISKKQIDTSEPNELIKMIESKMKPKTNKTVIDRLADSITNHPEFDNINKQKIKKYSFEIINSFNKKYPKLMKHLFKTKEDINALLQKKSDKAQKRALSQEKEVARKQEYSQKAKTERAEKKNKKYKHFDDLTDAELKKFKQARDYYMRKSKTSTILPKNLNKEDPEGLNNVCKVLAENGFDTMSEQLFMSEYDGSS
jgi:hypothetical protein